MFDFKINKGDIKVLCTLHFWAHKASAIQTSILLLQIISCVPGLRAFKLP